MNTLEILKAAEVINELPMPPFVYGLIMFAILTALAVVTFSFRDVANRHHGKAVKYAREHGRKLDE